eukprot:5186932-Pleurochrysis_carterae.AAC.2
MRYRQTDVEDENEIKKKKLNTRLRAYSLRFVAMLATQGKWHKAGLRLQPLQEAQPTNQQTTTAPTRRLTTACMLYVQRASERALYRLVLIRQPGTTVKIKSSVLFK